MEIFAAFIFPCFNVIFSIIYWFGLNRPVFWNLVGILTIISLLYYLISLLLISYQTFEKSSKSEARNYTKGSISLLFGLLTWYFVAFMVNFIGFDDNPAQNLIMKVFNFGIFWILNILTGYQLYSGFVLLNPDRKVDTAKSDGKGENKARTIFKMVILLVRSFTVISGFVLVIYVDMGVLIPGTVMPSLFGIGIVAGMLGLFFGLIGLTITVISLVAIINGGHYDASKSSNFIARIQKFLLSKKKPLLISISIIGVVISSIGFIPLFSTPSYINTTGKEFDRAFNPEFSGDWRAHIDETVETQYFRKAPFILSEYFWGPSSPSEYDCVTIKDILYFNGSESSYPQDKQITLYFDAFLPPNRGIGLPGQNSTLIRIHGGGWVVGDKGYQNVNMMNRYFASQGYCVFDIQYGLNNVSDLFKNLPSPDHVMGNFSIDDIMRHIGNFTKYLEQHASEFGANLDSTFISGGSAGGQLTCAVAYSLAHKNYTEFSQAYTIKGLIPYYPANNPQHEFAFNSRVEWVDPTLMINASSPACLIFQGDKDPLLPKAVQLQETYLNYGRQDCCLLIFPFAGHAADLYFTGYYNQVFLYYMERFMYLHR